MDIKKDKIERGLALCMWIISMAILCVLFLFPSGVYADAPEGAITGGAVTASSSMSPYGPGRATDGSEAPLSRWYSGALGDKWLQQSLGDTYIVDGWYVAGMGAAGWDGDCNLKTYRLEGSTDGNSWSTLDTVTNNTASFTKRNLTTPAAVSYVRLVITEGNQLNNYWASVLEFQVYGQQPPALTGTVVINGEALVGLTLSADVSGITNNTGTLSYQWRADGANIGANSPSYTLTDNELNKEITLSVTSSVETGALTSPATVAVTKDTTPPTVTVGAVRRTSETTATVTFTSSEAGSYHITIAEPGATELPAAGEFTPCNAGETTVFLEVSAGAKEGHLIVKDMSGNHVAMPAFAIGTEIDTSSTVTSVIVTPSAITLAPGATKQFTAAVQGTNSPAQTVTWSIDEALAGSPGSVTNIDNSGLLTINPEETAQTLTIRATSTANPSKSGTSIVTIGAATPGGITVSTAGALKEELLKITPATIVVDQDIILDSSGEIKLGASHTLIIPTGRAVTVSSHNIIVDDISGPVITFTIKGGGTFISQKKSHANDAILLNSGTLNLENITVNLMNTVARGITVKTMNINTGAVVTLDSIGGQKLDIRGGAARDGVLNLNAGGKLHVKNFKGEGAVVGTLNINGGEILIDPGQDGNYGLALIKGLVFNSGTLEGTTGGTIYLDKDTGVTGMSGKLKDRGTDFNVAGPVTVKGSTEAAISGELSQGIYFWNDGIFARNLINISQEPQNLTTTAGAVSGALSVTAAAGSGTPVAYQWYEVEWRAQEQDYFLVRALGGEVGHSYTLSSGLTAGSYLFACKLSAALCESTWSTVAAITVNPAPGGGSGSGSGSGSSTPAEQPASSSGGTATTTVKATVGNDGKATAPITSSQMSDAVKKAEEAAAKAGTSAQVEIKVTGAETAQSVEATVPQEGVEALAKSKVESMAVNTPVAAMTFDAVAMDTIAKETATSASGAGSSTVVFTAGKVSADALTPALRQLLGNRPVYEFSVTSGGKAISQFGGNVTVSIPYTPAAGEDPNAIIVSHINASGNLELVTNGRYDGATGMVVFVTDHFSQYAVGYNKINFSDVKDSAWYADAVCFLAAREITTGTAEGIFSPNGKLTRGQFMVMLMKAYGIAPDVVTGGTGSGTDNFADAGNTYYTGYLAAAKRLGLSGGVGDNLFAPKQEITRQEMFVLTYNVLKTIDRLSGETGETSSAGKADSSAVSLLGNFSDSEQISSWAKAGMETLVKAGIITGSDGKLSPKDTTTRAQMAQVLYQLMAAEI